MNKTAYSSYHVFFNNLANPLKIKIILELKKGEKNVTELSETLNVEQSKVSHALILLKKCNIVDLRKEGKQRFYSLNKKTIVPMFRLIDEHSKSFCNCTECKGCKEKK